MNAALIQTEPNFPAVLKLGRDLLRAKAMTAGQARYAVDVYYQLQDFRIQAAGQVRSAAASEQVEPSELVSWLLEQFATLETQIRNELGAWARQQVPGAWAQQITGIGPVISAGLAAHIDIEKAPTVGHIWRFAGLDPTLVWEKHQKRPYNARLKVLCWKIGDSFVKQSGRDSDIYGHLYRERKVQEVERNERLVFADQAAEALKRPLRDKALIAVYQSGKLPDGRIDLRARRWAVKLFLAHYHHVAFESHYGTPPPKPYILTKPEHTHYMGPPMWPMAK